MPDLLGTEDDKFEGFDKFVVIQGSRALQQVTELKKKPELLKAVEKYLEKELRETSGAIELADNL